MNGATASSLRTWRSLTSSGMSRSVAAGCGPSLSRQSRLEKPVRSVAGPCLTTAITRPSGSATEASIGMALNHLKRMGWARVETAEATR